MPHHSEVLNKVAKFGNLKRLKGLKMSLTKSEINVGDNNDLSSASDSSSNAVYSRPTISVPINLEKHAEVVVEDTDQQGDSTTEMQQQQDSHR